MARIVASTRVLALMARLDAAELAACRRLNGVVHRTGAVRLFRVASRLGDGVLWYALIAALALFFGSTGRLVALQSAVAGVSGLLIYRAIKGVLVRERPFITHSSIVCAGRPLDRFSFPSGHTLHAVSFTMVIGSSLPVVGWLLAPVAVLIALSRVVLGLHYPSDVLAGGLLGAAVASQAITWIVS
jgi:undecaprenyl-diphosphatase